MREKPTGSPRGFGFVIFSYLCVLDRVLRDRHTIDGRTVSLFPPFICIHFLVSIFGFQLFFVSGFWFLNWFNLGGCDCKSVVVGLLFRVLVCGGGLCDDGGEAVVLASMSGGWVYTPIGLWWLGVLLSEFWWWFEIE